MTPETAAPCLFCQIVEGAIPAGRLRESRDSLVIADLSPQAPHHYLLIPKRHAADIGQFMKGERAAEELADLLAQGLALAGEKGFAERGYRLVANTGPDGGQTVGHLHIHLLAGREMGWPPG